MFLPPRGILTLLVLFFSAHAFVFSQSDFTVSGGDASGVSGFMSFSIGQVSFESYLSDEGLISLGVQQSHGKEITLGSMSEEINFEIGLYPNPTRNEFQLDWNLQVPLDATAELYDIYGRKISEFNIKSDDDRFMVTSWPPGIYFVKIFRDQTLIKSMKLIKS